MFSLAILIGIYSYLIFELGLVGILYKDHIVLATFIFGLFILYSILSKGADVSVLYTTSLPGTTGLRQSVDAKDLLISNGLEVGKKVFYNFYNLYKLMPDIMPSFIFILFILSMFIREEERRLNYLKYTFLFMFLLSILSTSASIPFSFFSFCLAFLSSSFFKNA